MGGLPTGTQDIERTRTLWFALLLTLANGFLDAHTYIARGGVFANVQTANVIFFAIESSEGKWAAALDHVWPLLAFIAGMALASHIKPVVSSASYRTRCVGRWPCRPSCWASSDSCPPRCPTVM